MHSASHLHYWKGGGGGGFWIPAITNLVIGVVDRSGDSKRKFQQECAAALPERG